MNAERGAIISGSSGGIGAATARLLANGSYRICVNYRSNEVAANCLVGELTSCETTSIAVQANVGREDTAVRMFETVDQELGPVSAPVNNAGILSKSNELIQIRIVVRVVFLPLLMAIICRSTTEKICEFVAKLLIRLESRLT